MCNPGHQGTAHDSCQKYLNFYLNFFSRPHTRAALLFQSMFRLNYYGEYEEKRSCATIGQLPANESTDEVFLRGPKWVGNGQVGRIVGHSNV